MSADVQSLKAAVSFRELVSETHEPDRTGKVLCPVHDDHTPSCHIYRDGFKCFSCGAHGDAVDWLEAVHALSTAEAIKELERRAGGYIPPVAERPVKVKRLEPTFKPVSNHLVKRHDRAAQQLRYLPQAMTGRGFVLSDLRRLGFAAESHDAVFPITGPDGAVLALKRRYARPGSGPRYRYTTPGHGTPAWCSPDFDKDEVLIIEGELNGMICWLACPELAVMGVAGTGGALHTAALTGRTVYVYADGDEPGQKARDKWASSALSAGAAKVFVLDPWPADACESAGQEGRAALQKRLAGSLETTKSFDAIKSFSASNTASKDLRLAQGKPDLMFSCSRFSSGPKIGGKPCL